METISITNKAFYTLIEAVVTRTKSQQQIKERKWVRQHLRRQCIRLKEETRKDKAQIKLKAKSTEGNEPVAWHDTTWDLWRERMEKISQDAINAGIINPNHPAYWGIKSFENWQSPVED